MNNLRYLSKGFLLYMLIPWTMCKSTSLTEDHTQLEQLSTKSIPSGNTSVPMVNGHSLESDITTRRKQQEVLNKQLEQVYQSYQQEVERKEEQFKQASICQGLLVLMLCASQYTSSKASNVSVKKKGKNKK